MKRYVRWDVILCIQFRPHPLSHSHAHTHTYGSCTGCFMLTLTNLLLQWRCSFTFNWIYISFIVLALFSNRFVHSLLDSQQTPLLSQNSFISHSHHFLRLFRFHSLVLLLYIYLNVYTVCTVHLVHAVTRSIAISILFSSLNTLPLPELLFPPTHSTRGENVRKTKVVKIITNERERMVDVSIFFNVNTLFLLQWGLEKGNQRFWSKVLRINYIKYVP